MTAISVILPTHSPHPGRLARTLEGLRLQTLPSDQWELVLVDNGSPLPVSVEGSGIVQQRVVREDRLGLTYARLAGASASSGRLLVFVDDDNVLAPEYLERALTAFDQRPEWGAGGGRSIPEWEVEPEPWVMEFAGNLALRDLGCEERSAGPGLADGYPACSPIGAGMVVRSEAWPAYASKLNLEKEAITDRKGNSLASGGDCDIVLHILRGGWKVAYLPGLELRHLIPAGRTTREYLARLNRGIAASWVRVLARHGIQPWPQVSAWSVPFRKARAYFRNRAWAGPAEYVRWQGACGQFEGRVMPGGMSK